MATFQLECHQNEFLPEGGDRVTAIVRVTSAGSGLAAVLGPGPTPDSGSETDRAEVIIIDASGSMDGVRLREARQAAEAAIDCIEDGVRFALVAGNHSAWRLYPDQSGMALAVSSPASREDARSAVRRLRAGGGTAIGQWLDLTTGLLRDQHGINHAILLTDGVNETESEADLDGAIERATGAFQCDCRGVGGGWKVSELRRVSDGLLGNLGMVAVPSGLSEDFRTLMQGSMARSVAGVTLRLWVPANAEVDFVKQVSPAEQVLVAGPAEPDAMTRDYDTGAWGDESRDYHLSIRVAPAGLGEERLAGRVTLLVGDEPAGQALVRAVWTDDVERSTTLNRMVADYTGQAEAAALIADAIEVRHNGDDSAAADKLTQALHLTRQAGNTENEARILALVDEDPVTGKIKMKRTIDPLDEMDLDTNSRRTKRVDP